ncbi:ADAL-like protein [Mya arenaria]|uniref:ADAL-like protein n=1 Tax=Mya arenaria TaxID=6604 RepID=A0ABY7DSG6_MYAAR|nr:ADAL-like protein [Mya arenaria]
MDMIAFYSEKSGLDSYFAVDDIRLYSNISVNAEKTDGLVVGIDFSGDPNAGDGAEFIPVFEEGRLQGLKLALHLAETDDKGVFSTTLSREYSIAAETFSLSDQQMWDLSYRSIDFIFSGEHVKQMLRKKWTDSKDGLSVK